MKEDISNLDSGDDSIEVDGTDVINSNLSVDKYEIISQVSDFNVATIVNYIEQGAIIVPEYQRNYLWSLSEASKLVESLILNLPIPPMFLFKDKDYNFYLIDGQQRLMSIYFFFKNKFPKKDGYGIPLQSNRLNDLIKKDELFDEFRLSLINVDNSQSVHNNKTLHDIGEKEFSFLYIRTIIIETRDSLYSENIALEMFNRFNQSIRQLTSAEKRFARYYSKSYQMLCDFNEDNVQWRKILGYTELQSLYHNIEQVDFLLFLFIQFRVHILKNENIDRSSNFNSIAGWLALNNNIEEIHLFLHKFSSFSNLLFDIFDEFHNSIRSIDIGVLFILFELNEKNLANSLNGLLSEFQGTSIRIRSMPMRIMNKIFNERLNELQKILFGDDNV